MQAIEELELRLAFADSAEKLTRQLDMFLCPLLLELASSDLAIRNKVLSVLAHINKRSSGNQEVIFPTHELCKLFVEKATSASNLMVSNFALVYIEMGFGRVQDRLVKRECLELLLTGYHLRSANQQQIIFHLFLASIDCFITGRLDSEVLSLIDKLADEFLVLFGSLMDVMLYNASSPPINTPFLTHNGKVTQLSALKLPILKFIIEHYPSQQNPHAATVKLTAMSFLMFTVASCDPFNDVNDFGDDAIKKRGRPSLDEPFIVTKMYSLYLSKQHPINFSCKYKLLNLLAKSALGVNILPFCVQVVFDALSIEGAGVAQNKVRLAGMGLMQWIIRICTEQTLQQISKVFIESLINYISNTGTVAAQSVNDLSLREFAYGALAALLKRNRSLIFAHFDVISLLFRNVYSEVSAQESISTIADILGGSDELDEMQLQQIRDMVLVNVSSESHSCRFAAVTFALKLMKKSSAFFTFVLLLASADVKLEIKESCQSGLGFIADFIVNFQELAGIVSEHMHMISTPSVWSNVVRYLRNLLLITCDASYLQTGSISHVTNSVALDFSDDAKLAALNSTMRNSLKIWFRGNDIVTYLRILEHVLNAKSLADSAAEAISLVAYRDVIIFSDSHHGLEKVEWLVQFLKSQRTDSRETVAHSIGIILSNHPEAGIEFIQRAIDNDDLVITVGYIIGRLYYRNGTVVPEYLFKSAIEKGNLSTLSEIGRYFPIVDSAVIDKLIERIKTEREHKSTEIAISTLSHLCIPDARHSKKVIDFFLELASSKSKQFDAQLTIGEGLSCVVAGWKSSAAKLYLDLYGNDGKLITMESEERVCFAETLDLILNTYLINNQKSPADRRSVCIWLLSLVKFCPDSQEITSRLGKIQKAFSAMLGDKEEFIQEIASKGISTVYSLGDDSIKDDLVKSLVGSFSDEASVKMHNITGETELFEADTLGKTPDGGSVTTYKELCALASDLNKPDLVYKFMSLASHNLLWNSRQGAAYGFTEIIAKANEEMKPHLPNLIPKLYRYSFDPQVKVAESMKNIWNSLVKDTRKTIDEYFSLIMEDLLKNIIHRQWRTRESACNALADLVSTRDMSQTLPYLEKVWQMTFRALDDIKESVRKSGFNLCRTLTNMTIKYCEPVSGSKSQASKILEIVVPYMLKNGLTASAEDVQNFALATILQICKKTGSLVAPFVADIIDVLLEGMSSLEPQVMNYISFHVDKYDITQEQLDSTRLSAAKMSPVMEAIEICAGHLNEVSFDLLQPKLVNLIRKGVGLPTKGGTARFVVIACIKVPYTMSSKSQNCDAILRAMSGAILDKSPALRVAFASAVGYIIKYCTSETQRKFFAHLRAIYIEKDYPDQHEAVALTLNEISKHSTDVFQSFSTSILPLVYFGSFDPNELVKGRFKEVWDKNTGTLQNFLIMYESELTDLVIANVKSQSWPAKIQSAEVLRSMGLTLKNCSPVVDAFLESISGRIWTGKEHLLQALVSVESLNDVDLLKIKDMLLRECQKNNKIYKRYAIDAVGVLLQKYERVDCFEELFAIISPILEGKPVSKNQEDMDTDEDLADKPVLNLLTASTLKTLGAAWRLKHTKRIEWLLEFMLKSANDVTTAWNVKTGAIESLDLLGKQLKSDGSLIRDQTFQEIVTTFLSVCADGRYGIVREKAADSMKTWADLKPQLKSWTRSKIADAISKETAPNIKTCLEKCI